MGLYISLLCQLRRPKSHDILVIMSTPRDQSWIPTPFSNKRPGLLGKMDESRTGARHT